MVANADNSTMKDLIEVWQNPKNKTEFHLFSELELTEEDSWQFLQVNNYLTPQDIGQLLGGN